MIHYTSGYLQACSSLYIGNTGVSSFWFSNSAHDLGKGTYQPLAQSQFTSKRIKGKCMVNAWVLVHVPPPSLSLFFYFLFLSVHHSKSLKSVSSFSHNQLSYSEIMAPSSRVFWSIEPCSSSEPLIHHFFFIPPQKENLYLFPIAFYIFTYTPFTSFFSYCHRVFSSPPARKAGERRRTGNSPCRPATLLFFLSIYVQERICETDMREPKIGGILNTWIVEEDFCFFW